MRTIFAVAVFLVSFAVPVLSAASAPGTSAIAICRTLRDQARIDCLGKQYGAQFGARFSVSSTSSSVSSSSSIPPSYRDTFQDEIGRDPNFIPEGASCVRFTDARRALCRLKQFKDGTGKSASSSSTSSFEPEVSLRRRCQRLAELEKTKCLRDARGAIDVMTRSVK